jgi:hypothetical protein
LVLLAAAGAACSAPSVTLPAAAAPPMVVVEAYLGEFRAGDCTNAHALWTKVHVVGDGDLCGSARLQAFVINPDVLTPGTGQVIVSTTLTTGGSDDRSVPAGDISWNFTLERRPNGAWRITEGGTG